MVSIDVRKETKVLKLIITMMSHVGTVTSSDSLSLQSEDLPLLVLTLHNDHCLGICGSINFPIVKRNQTIRSFSNLHLLF